MAENKLSSISKADSLEKMGKFWDTHDFTDFDDTAAPDVEFEVSCTVPIEEELFSLVEKQAKLRGVKVETLVNLWLQQKLAEHMRSIAVQKET
jgi:hypothetical protein